MASRKIDEHGCICQDNERNCALLHYYLGIVRFEKRMKRKALMIQPAFHLFSNVRNSVLILRRFRMHLETS